ncbi:MAG: type II toxin-antitoxin system HicA family toxin [Deltaproteobacteria bacterium]|nr:type II toxin-antitoxin system HicA family toxin [Deltaproteobacteria bacterium]
MKSLSGRRLCRILEAHGWQFQRVHGSHHIYAQPRNPIILSVPVHGNKDLKKGTLAELLKAASLTEDDI